MRTTITLLLIATVCIAGATVKDPRTNLKPVAPQTQEEVAREQALQKQQAQVGGVPQKTDGTGYAPTFQDDPNAASVIAGHANQSNSASEGSDVLKTNAEVIEDSKPHPAKTAFGAIWALLAGLLVAVGAWAGLQKYGPKPPEHLSRT